MGHRFLGGKVEFSNPSDYEEVLLKEFVIADAAEKEKYDYRADQSIEN